MGVIPDKPGSEWTAEERQRVRAWVCEPDQLKQLFATARAWFPKEKEEGVWSEFFGSRKTQQAEKEPPKSRFDLTIDRFDPSKGASFWSYLRRRFSYFCMERRKVIGREQDRNISLDEPDEEAGEPRFSPVAPDGTFEQVCLRELGQAILECWLELASELNVIFALRYFSEDLTYISDDERAIREVARVLVIPENLAKVRLFRARKSMKKCLKQKGFEP